MNDQPASLPVLEAEPPLDAFSSSYAKGESGIVWARLVADLETPVSAMLKLSRGRPLSFLLESVEGGAVRGRYSVIGLEPDLVWRAFGSRAEISTDPSGKPGSFVPEPEPTLTSLRSLLGRSRIALPPELPPMAAGVFGYMGYDTVRLAEHLPNVPPDVLDVPDAVLVRPTVMVIFDAVKDEMTVATPVFPAAGLSATAAYARAVERLTRVVASLDEPVPHMAVAADALSPPAPVSNTPEADYLEMVGRCKEYIAAGDAFQIVVSQRFSAPFTLPPFALYRALRRTNPSPFL
ncbi:MAG: chorismate-binding protein, partial [Hyphomicrobiaceae bacterium]